MARGRLFGLLLALLERLAEEQPLVLVMEDVHWADRSTSELGAFLTRNLRRTAVLQVVTFRTDELDRAGMLRRLLAELGRLDGVTRLDLERLSAGQVAAQLAGILGRQPDPAVATAVYERGGGNPLLTEVLLNADGTLAPGLPGPARDLLLGAVSGLAPDCQRVLRTAAARQVGTDRVGVMEIAAEAARLAGEPERGLPLAEAAVGSLDAERDGERLASLLRLRAALRQQMLLPGQLADLRTALRLAAQPTRVRAQVLGQLIRVLRLQDRDDEARVLAGELQNLASQLGDEAFGVEAQIRLAHVGRQAGREVIPDLEQAAALAQRIGSGPLELLARVEITNALQARGLYEAAIQAGRADLARASQLGLARYVTAPIAANLAESLTAAGRWDEALEVIEESLAQNLAPFGPARCPAAAAADHPAGPAGAGRPSGCHRPGRAGRAVRADRPRAGSAAAGRGRAQQPADGRRAVHLSQDRQRARVQHPRQTRRHRPGGGGCYRPPAAPARPGLTGRSAMAAVLGSQPGVRARRQSTGRGWPIIDRSGRAPRRLRGPPRMRSRRLRWHA